MRWTGHAWFLCGVRHIYIILAGKREDNHECVMENGSKVDIFLIFKLVGGFTPRKEDGPVLIGQEGGRASELFGRDGEGRTCLFRKSNSDSTFPSHSLCRRNLPVSIIHAVCRLFSYKGDFVVLGLVFGFSRRGYISRGLGISHEWWVGKDLYGLGCGLFHGTYVAFASWDWGKPRAHQWGYFVTQLLFEPGT
jgi:hypothetical protein